jgi:dTDP-glucose pyrophosphorylase
MKSYLIAKSEKILKALEIINSPESKQTLIVVDKKNNQVVGTITDGDIRRGFLKQYTINDTIDKIMNKEFIYLLDKGYDLNKIKHIRKNKIKLIPVLNKDKELKDVIDFTFQKTFLPIDAIIMAGGKGTRLKPLTNDTPKPLLQIGGKEIISYNFDRLAQYGITNQFITVNYLGQKIQDYCDNYDKKINFQIIHETEFLGTAGAISLIDYKKFQHDLVLIMNSDLLTNVDYEDFFNSFLEHNADMMVASVPYNVNLPYAIFELDNKEIRSFSEKPTYTYYANAGIYLIKKELLTVIPKKEFFDATDLMNSVMKKNKKLLHYPIRSYWLDIGKHEDFNKAQSDVKHIDFD